MAQIPIFNDYRDGSAFKLQQITGRDAFNFLWGSGYTMAEVGISRWENELWFRPTEFEDHQNGCKSVGSRQRDVQVWSWGESSELETNLRVINIYVEVRANNSVGKATEGEKLKKSSELRSQSLPIYWESRINKDIFLNIG